MIKHLPLVKPDLHKKALSGHLDKHQIFDMPGPLSRWIYSSISAL